MIHRGPDSAGTFLDQGIAIGMRRLSIIDVVGGAQPISSEDERITVVQNGEIYNFIALRQELERKGHKFKTNSDTEILVHGYEQWGTSVVNRLNGMFAFAIWDSDKELLFLGRDRMGIKPLYWSYGNEILIFGSELKALLASGILRPTVDNLSLGQYLIFEYVPAPRSIFAQVNKLEAGCTLSFHRGDAPSINRYWNLEFEPERSRSEGEAREQILSSLESALRLELVSDVPLGILTSGGIDSTAVTLSARRVSQRPVKTFSVGFDDRSFDESTYAREVARYLETDHHEITLQPHQMSHLVDGIAEILDEPLADSSMIPTYLLSKFTREHVTVALGGDGGDELWAGYPTMVAHRAARLYRNIPRWLREKVFRPVVSSLPVSFDNISLDFRLKRFIRGMDVSSEFQHHLWIGGYSPEQVRALCKPSLEEDLSDEALLEPITRRLPHIANFEPMDRLLYLDATLYLEGDILTKVDRASMACSLEVRVPMLNLEVIDVARKIPFEWKLKGARGKSILRDTIAPYVSNAIASRPKKGFNLPISRWLQSSHAYLLRDVANNHWSMFETSFVQDLVGQHLSGKSDNRKLLWPLVVFTMWEAKWNKDKAFDYQAVT